MAGTRRTDQTYGAALEVVSARHPGRVVGAIAVAVIAAWGVQLMATNERFRWDEFWVYLLNPRILEGLFRTIYLTIGAMAIGIGGGTLLAVMRLSSNRLISGAAWTYVFVFRGTPVLVQLIFWYNLSALFPSIDLGIPFGPVLFSFDANDVISVNVAALFGLGFCEAAYMAEIVRAGIVAVDRGQTDAANALGMSSWITFRKVVMPQAMRLIVPPTANDVIGMLKTTALVSVIALPDLLYTAQLIYNREFNTIPLLIVASFWYLVLTTVLSIFQYFIERHFGRSDAKRNTKGPRGGLRSRIFSGLGAPATEAVK